MKSPKVVVITGASAGVRRATVRRFAQAGCDIGLIARGHAGLEGARRDVEAAGGRALELPLDVSDYAAVDAAAERVERELGPIDVWVNDAMTTVFGEFKDLSPDEFRRVTEVDYLGFVWGTHAALKRMLARDRGTIVQVGSALAYRAIPLQSAYCGAKHAIRGFSDSLRTELMHAGSKVWVTMVQMPALNTPQFAKTGFASQQYDGPPPKSDRANLWRPVDERDDHGAHGSFDRRAHGRSAELWTSLHERSLLAGLGATTLAAGVVAWRALAARR